ncbi:hypothetical protein AAC387_Pa05g3769 [Persea americana]
MLAPSHLNRGSRFSIAALSVYAIAETLVNGTAYKRNSAQKSDGLWILSCSRTLSRALVREKAKLLPAAMAEVEIDGLELEAMRRDDHSWHPCQVSLSPCTVGGSGLVVDFENCTTGDIISTEKEAVARLRIRSVPLQDGDCFHIKEGEHILAMHGTQLRSLFFDAEVEKILRVRHSLRVHCRCTFTIKWLHPNMKGEITNVSSSSVRKLARYNIQSHPIVAAFLNSMSPLHSSDRTPSLTFLEDTGDKTGLQRLLEEQIEEISKVADAPTGAVSDEVLLGVRKVEHAGRTRSKAFVASDISFLHDKTRSKNDFTASTKKQGEVKLDMESKDLPLFQLSPEEHFQESSCLSPLAARARLASLMYELPQNPEISIYHVEKEGYLDTSQNTPAKHMNVVSLGVTRMFMNSDICIQENLSVASNHSSVAASVPVASNPIEISNCTFGEPMLGSISLAPSRKRSVDKFQLEDSYETVTLQEKSIPMPQVPEDRKSNASTITARFMHSAMNRKSNSTTITARANRSTIQDMGNGTHKIKLKPPAKDGNLNSPTMSKRLTRSAIQKEIGHSVNEVDMSSSTKDAEANNLTRMTRITRSANQKEAGKSVDYFELEPSTKDGNLNSPVMANNTTITRMATHSTIQDMGNETDKVKLKPPSKDGNLNSPTMTKRLTRSAIQKEMSKRLTCSAIQQEIGHLVNKVDISPSTKDAERNSLSRKTRITRSANQEAAGKSVTDSELEPSTKDGNLNSPAMTKRLTRSAFQKGLGSSVNEVRMGSSAEDGESNSATMTRITRSANQKRAGKSVNEIKTESSSKDGRLNTPSMTKVSVAIQNDMENSVCEDMRTSPTKETKLNSPSMPARLTRSASRKEMGNSVKELKLVSSTEEGRPAITTRLTRSTSREGMMNSVNDIELESSTKERKLSSPTIRTRSTHSAIHKEVGTDVDEIKINFETEEWKSHSPLTTTRLTRSAFHREMGSSVDEVELESAAKDTKLDYPLISRRLTRSAARKDMGNSIDEVNVDSSTKGKKLNSPDINLLTHFTSQKEMGYSVEKVKLDSSVKGQKLNSTCISSRLTRSAVRKEWENITSEAETELERGKSTQDLGVGDPVELVTPENKGPKKRLFSSSFDADSNASQGKRKMVKVSSTIIIINDSEGGISARSEGSKVRKPQLRFSHRLRFLPRTRSQRRSLSSC